MPVTGRDHTTPPWQRTDWLACALIFALTVLTRLPFVSHILYAWDSVNYAFGMRGFDVIAESPQPPGYILYVFAARALNAVLHSANASLVTISVIAGALAAVALYVLGRELYGRRFGLVAAVLLATCPLFWFYGEIALPHTLDAALVITTVWLLVLLGRGRIWAIWPAAVALALAGGVRPQTLVFLLPLAVWCGRRAGWRAILPAALLCAALCAAWFIPLAQSAGGISPYLHKLSTYSARFEASTSVFRGAGLSGLEHNVGKLVAYTVFAAAFALVPAIVWLVLRLRRRRPELAAGREVWTVLGLWTTPALLYYVFIHMGQQGMIFIFLPAVLIVLALALTRLAHGRTLIALLAAVALADALVFVALPQHLPGLGQTFPTRDTIAANDRYYQERFDLVRTRYSSQDTIVIAGNWRHVEYYLPQYRLFRLGAADDPAGEGRPEGWPGGGGFLSGQVRPYGSGDVNLLLFDDGGSDLYAALPDVKTVPVPDSGEMLLYTLPVGLRLIYSGPRLEVQPPR